MAQQQRNPIPESLAGGVAEDKVERSDHVVGPPVDLGRRGQPALQQQSQPAVVGPEHRVVEPLGFVGICPGVEQQRGQRPGMGMRRLADEAAFPFAHRSGQGGEPIGAVPHEVGVGVGPVRQQQPRGRDGVGAGKLLGHPRVAEVEQRRPVARSARGRRPPRLLAQELLQPLQVGRRRGAMRAGPRQVGLRRQHRLGAADPLRRIVAIGQAGQVQKPIRLAPARCRAQLVTLFRQLRAPSPYARLSKPLLPGSGQPSAPARQPAGPPAAPAGHALTGARAPS